MEFRFFPGVLMIVWPVLAGVLMVVYVVRGRVFLFVRMSMPVNVAVQMRMRMGMCCPIAVRVFVGMGVRVLVAMLVFLLHAIASRISDFTPNRRLRRRRDFSVDAGQRTPPTRFQHNAVCSRIWTRYFFREMRFLSQKMSGSTRTLHFATGCALLDRLRRRNPSPSMRLMEAVYTGLRERRNGESDLRMNFSQGGRKNLPYIARRALPDSSPKGTLGKSTP